MVCSLEVIQAVNNSIVPDGGAVLHCGFPLRIEEYQQLSEAEKFVWP